MVDILETVRDRAKRTKIWDPYGTVYQVYTHFTKKLSPLPVLMLQQEVAVISETVRDKVKRTKIWDP